MIEKEVAEILQNPDPSGRRLNNLVDEFRRGRDVCELLDLLDSDNDENISIGTWILAEIHHELYRNKKIMGRLLKLSRHQNAQVRFNTFSALYPTLSLHHDECRKFLECMLRDPNCVIRSRAERALQLLCHNESDIV